MCGVLIPLMISSSSIDGMLGQLNNRDIVQTCQGREPSSVVTVLVHKRLRKRTNNDHRMRGVIRSGQGQRDDLQYALVGIEEHGDFDTNINSGCGNVPTRVPTDSSGDTAIL